MVGTKRVILLAGHNFISPGCNTNIDGKLITEFDMTSYLVAEVFKRERLMGIDLIIKARNDFGNLVNEVNSLNGDILISCHTLCFATFFRFFPMLVGLYKKCGIIILKYKFREIFNMNNIIKFLDNNLEYLTHEIIEDTIYITVVSNRTSVKCPYCSKESKKLHSYYTRSFQDLPIQDKKVIIVIKNKKFICENKECFKTTFSESFNCVEFKSKKSKRLIEYIVDLSMRVSSINASNILRKNVVNVGKSTIYNILKKR